MSYNPYEEYDRHVIRNNQDLSKMQQLFLKDSPKVGGFDTETSGLHLIKDRPFLYVFGWLVPGENYGRVFTFYPTQDNLKVFKKLSEKLRMNVGHNITYDLSMNLNIGLELSNHNLVENMVLARLSLEALSVREGGDNLSLKSLGTKYVHPLAAHSEKKVKEELKRLNEERVKVLTAALKQFDHPTETETKPYRLDTGKKTSTPYANKNPDNVEWHTKPKKWNKGLVEDFLKDLTNDVDDLPKDVREVWIDWKEEYPEPTYEDVDRELMLKYAAEDVITMLEFAKRALPIIKERQQQDILKRECELIPAIVDMERHGLKVDRDYLESCRKNLKQYIIKKRKQMYELAGSVVNVGQDQTILKVFYENWGIELPQCNKAQLKKVKKNELELIDVPEKAKEYADCIMKLRSLEKWYSTYITRILERSEYDGRLYLQLNQAGAVSGRFTSDGQQFPKSNLVDDDGNELYHPRKAYIADEGTKWYFLDYSQIELRNQANYTILVSGGDKNLCRAYMPFECTGQHNGQIGMYNYLKPEKRKYWKLPNFWTDEEGNLWTPTDVHGETTHNALMELGYTCHYKYEQYTFTPYEAYGQTYEGFFGNHIDKERFKEVRSKGKIFNFMKNYGGGLGAAMSQLDLPKDVAQALIDGYSTAFPGVTDYQNMVIQTHHKRGYVQNAYGRRYYLTDMDKSYVLANYLIQGTCADMLKESIINCYNYLKSQNCKTKMIMNIHDEIQFISVPGEEHHIMACKRIMEDHDWHMVPIVTDIEVTETDWASKEEVAV